LEVAAIAFNAMAQAAAADSGHATGEFTGRHAGPQTEAAGTVSAAEEIEKLAELHADGILTDQASSANEIRHMLTVLCVPPPDQQPTAGHAGVITAKNVHDKVAASDNNSKIC
jgi:hypothetical protein